MMVALILQFVRLIYNWIYNEIIPFGKKHLRHHGKRFRAKNTGKLLKRLDS